MPNLKRYFQSVIRHIENSGTFYGIISAAVIASLTFIANSSYESKLRLKELQTEYLYNAHNEILRYNNKINQNVHATVSDLESFSQALIDIQLYGEEKEIQEVMRYIDWHYSLNSMNENQLKAAKISIDPLLKMLKNKLRGIYGLESNNRNSIGLSIRPEVYVREGGKVAQ